MVSAQSSLIRQEGRRVSRLRAMKEGVSGGWRRVPHVLDISTGRAGVFPLLATSCIPLGCKEVLAGGSELWWLFISPLPRPCSLLLHLCLLDTPLLSAPRTPIPCARSLLPRPFPPLVTASSLRVINPMRLIFPVFLTSCPTRMLSAQALYYLYYYLLNSAFSLKFSHFSKPSFI